MRRREIRYPDRLALLIRRKEPYIAWANSFDDGGPSYEPTHDRATVLLIDEDVDGLDLKKTLRRYWREIFETELENWMRDPEVWPKRRTYGVFLKWFDVQVCEMVADLGRWPIEYD